MGGRGGSSGGGGGVAAGAAAFSGVLKRGVTGGGMRARAPFRAAFADAAARGVSATALASSGKYFGSKVQPIQINVYHDGKTTLSDGRHRYSAARAAGAGRILATVTHYGPRGGVRSEKTAVIRLR